VVFEPTKDGIVTTFTITGVSAERRDGGHVVKDVVIEAPVRVPSGQTVQKTLVITLQRAEPPDQRSRAEGWIVTGFKDERPAAATPRS